MGNLKFSPNYWSILIKYADGDKRLIADYPTRADRVAFKRGLRRTMPEAFKPFATKLEADAMLTKATAKLGDHFEVAECFSFGL